MKTLPAIWDVPPTPNPTPVDRHWLLGLKFLYQLENVVRLGFHLPEAEFAALLDRVYRNATQTMVDHLRHHS